MYVHFVFSVWVAFDAPCPQGFMPHELASHNLELDLVITIIVQ
jgi:hypothetical protein